MLDHMLFDLKKWFSINDDAVEQNISDKRFIATPKQVVVSAGATIYWAIGQSDEVKTDTTYHVWCVGYDLRHQRYVYVLDQGIPLHGAHYISVDDKHIKNVIWEGVKPSKPRLTGLLTALRRVVISWL